MRLRSLALALLSFCGQAQAQQAEPLTIDVRPIAEFQRGAIDNQYGPLTFLGGLALTSSHGRFEALSGLTMVGDTLLMVTDEGDWIRATLESDATGKPLAVSNAVLGPLLDTSGAPMRTKRLADAESITHVEAQAWVTSERNQPIRAYQLDEEGLQGAATRPFGDQAPLVERWNLGIEAMAHVEAGPLAGQTLVFLEEPPRNAAAPTAARLTADGQVIPFAVRRADNFAITGAAALPSGDIVVVERRFGWQSGLFMRLRYLPANEIAAGAVQGRLMLHADASTAIDNMEGIAVSDHPNGPILTLISDDNGNFFQRTVLLRFQITGNLDSLSVPTLPPPVARPNQ